MTENAPELIQTEDFLIEEILNAATSGNPINTGSTTPDGRPFCVGRKQTGGDFVLKRIGE